MCVNIRILDIATIRQHVRHVSMLDREDFQMMEVKPCLLVWASCQWFENYCNGKDKGKISWHYYYSILFVQQKHIHRQKCKTISEPTQGACPTSKKVLNLPRILAQIIHYRNKDMSVKFEVLNAPHLIQWIKFFWMW